MREVRDLRLFALLAALVLVFAACGGDDDDGGGGGGDGEVTIIHGTTDPWVSFDPSGSYDLPSWNVIYNVFEGLMTIPPGGGVPEPALAESCEFTDPQTYQCTLKEGVTFHDGSTLDSGDVATSFERNIRIASPNGACSLLASLAACEKWTGDEIETPDDRTVIFHLNTADATWPSVLTTGSAGIVPSEYPARDIQADDQAIGTGPYQVTEFRPGELLELTAFEDYHGDAPANDRVLVNRSTSRPRSSSRSSRERWTSPTATSPRPRSRTCAAPAISRSSRDRERRSATWSSTPSSSRARISRSGEPSR